MSVPDEQGGVDDTRATPVETCVNMEIDATIEAKINEVEKEIEVVEKDDEGKSAHRQPTTKCQLLCYSITSAPHGFGS